MTVTSTWVRTPLSTIVSSVIVQEVTDWETACAQVAVEAKVQGAAVAPGAYLAP